jgi:hypothetical protein
MALPPVAYSTCADTVYVDPTVHEMAYGPLPEVDTPGPILKPVPEYTELPSSATVRAVMGTLPVFCTLKLNRHSDMPLEHSQEDDSERLDASLAWVKYPPKIRKTIPAMAIVTAISINMPIISPIPLLAFMRIRIRKHRRF